MTRIAGSIFSSILNIIFFLSACVYIAALFILPFVVPVGIAILIFEIIKHWF